MVDGGAGFDIINLDFAKAFDKVPIKRLLKKVPSSWDPWTNPALDRELVEGQEAESCLE